MSEEELYNDIVERLSKGDFLQINGKPINLKELNDYINSQQQEIERLKQRIDKAIEYIEDNSDDMHTYISQVLTDILKGSDK